LIAAGVLEHVAVEDPKSRRSSEKKKKFSFEHTDSADECVASGYELRVCFHEEKCLLAFDLSYGLPVSNERPEALFIPTDNA
jgi:hypothetical protein